MFSKPSIAKIAALTAQKNKVNILENIIVRPAINEPDLDVDTELQRALNTIINEAENIPEICVFPNIDVFRDDVLICQKEAPNNPEPQIAPNVQIGPEAQIDPNATTVNPIPIDSVESGERLIFKDVEMEEMMPFDQLEREAVLVLERETELDSVRLTHQEVNERMQYFGSMLRNCQELLEVLNQRERAIIEQYEARKKQERLLRILIQH